MLLKVKFHNTKKYIKLQSSFTYLEFIKEVKNKFGLPDAAQLDIFDETDTAIEEYILLELLEANSDLCLVVRDSSSDEDHSTPSSLTDSITLSSSDSDLRELGIPTGRKSFSKEDTSGPATKASVAEGAKEEHFYDGEKGTGYLAWRLKTISRITGKRPVKEASVHQAQGPKRRRSATTLPQQLDGDACREAISFLVHSPDEALVFQKMKMTFQHRQDLVHDPQRSTDIFKTFPRFLDVKGLANQDFLLMFGAETASKMLEKWDTSFKPKVIKEAKQLTQTTELCRLLRAAEKLTGNNETDWDSDIASMLLLLYLLPPTAGRKRTKISPSDAVDKMLHFHKSCCSIDEYLQERDGKHPYILAIGRTQKTIDTFYIAIDKQLILCQATSSLGAFDELFKSHYVFNLSYDESLVHFYTFLQTTVYNIDITTTDESPRVRELRAKLLNDI
ncbi:hypothetical protein DPEC_G00041820 [Dallia pectoralis]|uniref:Uncharacterized protein n=1 Tax=Dallia pectoralis TaxID=75939 RepID=A0ACC2H9Z1_DALPE|nr:hypothetical protein DPEC_G00041820 [Dallia pectoralis]